MTTMNCNNLEAEMKRIGISKQDLADFLDISYRTVHSRINGESQWLYRECVSLRDEFFPGMRLDYLFPREQTKIGGE
ncbi:MAG: XRE family transcriptional regulator [Clostridia bacterium]|nr:XRE family transcriptional regulator [Clostridia bacterium]NCD04041.1 XRE family transcriptional regulator [Clostridia bacterium]